MSLEVLPDLFNGVEFWCIAWKPFDMKTRVVFSNFPDDRTLVDLSLIPQENNIASQMMKKIP